MLLRLKWLLMGCLFLGLGSANGQRSYQAHSVLATGVWFKIAITQTGVHKIDLAFLSSLGISTAGLASNSIRLYGNGGQMLSESNNGAWLDDLQENAIQVVDGGDGVMNGSDYLLFYAEGPHRWIKDSSNQRFNHQKNLYSDRSFYYISIGGAGKRISVTPLVSNPSVSISQFSGRYFHELDTVNFLASGKEWFGEEFSNLPGRTLTRSFPFPGPNIIAGSSVSIRSNCISRSIGAGSIFSVGLNNTVIGSMPLAPVGAGQFDLFAQQATALFNANAASTNTISLTYSPGSYNAQGWLNWWELFTRQQLSLNGLSQLSFRDWNSVGNQAGEFILSNVSASTQVWDVTDAVNPLSMQSSLQGTELRFINRCERLREYIAFNGVDFLQPVSVGRINNQDLHGASPKDYLIVVHPPFLTQAQRLAQFHEQKNNLRVLVVTTDQIYNEFGSGSPDPTTVRDFVKMYFDKYNNNLAERLRYLLLLGDGSYDYKNRIAGNTNYVPVFENNISLDVLNTYTTDDFFGFLNDQEDINSGVVINQLDIGIGRVPAKNPEEAKNFVDKVLAYTSASAMGPWRNNLLFIADDEDQNLHLQDAEIISQTSSTTNPLLDINKIYLDAFQQESGTGGSSYPQVNQAINNQVYNGVLIWNFTGHGGPRRLAEETILDQETVNNWNNPDRLPLFITATCDFAPFDNPLINSLGENILVRPKTGGIALMTTTRVVFAYSNRVMNNNYMQFALQPDANGRYRSLGDAVKEAKNFTYQTSSDITNNRKFMLLGDPALTIAFPTLRAGITRVNGLPVNQADTLSAGEKITVEGELTDLQGNLLTGFNGSVYPTVFDKPQVIRTIGNDPGSSPVGFTTQTNALFKGKATVSRGRFNFSFKVPKDINYQFGNGRVSLYAADGSVDANGIFSNFIVGGSSNASIDDKEGPTIKPYLNDERFVNGGLSNENPVLILKLEDSSGINTVGTGIGHDIVATLDNDSHQFFVLNEFYQGEENSYQRGMVHFQMPELEPGPHSLKIKAWDVMNNSSEVLLDFTVGSDEDLTINHVLNYPNPFTTSTQFWFEHNKPGQDLLVRVQIFSVSGRVIKMLEKTINTPGNRSIELEWDGKDQYGDKIGRGVYLYKLTVTLPGKSKKEKIERLVIL